MDKMLDKMDPKKKKALIQAALMEFGNNSYKKASTNNIVKNANISKGLLYHYFKNKKALYEYLISFFFINTTKRLVKKIDFENRDLLYRIERITIEKTKIIHEYPGLVPFARQLYAGKGMEEIINMFNEYAPGFYEDFFKKNIDFALFKEGIDVRKAIEITQWTVEKISENFIVLWQEEKTLDVDALFKEFDSYMAVLRAAFYK